MHTGGLPESFSKQSSLDPAQGLTWSKICIMVFYHVNLDQPNFMCMLKRDCFLYININMNLKLFYNLLRRSILIVESLFIKIQFIIFSSIYFLIKTCCLWSFDPSNSFHH
jgi:hypothetical protein